MMSQRINLDHASATMVLLEVGQAMATGMNQRLKES